ncbi:site-specific recombinase, phage integrase family [Oesophagostomum dentatum]|uniref:Site-specific recombinase, phage integrase family n=1 Tax=Oesophagostomum dentatum TaxID=61180 RepID=A0A0B1RQT5_OESDE|nr:site-specific recombinase, phage integrase family [Oesophagostomum dentatum]
MLGDAELQKLLIDSAKRDAAPVTHRKKATEEDIGTVVGWALNKNTKACISAACIILLSFLAFLRVSEAACVRKSHLENKGNDIWWLHIPKSKTDQKGKGTTVAFKVKGIHCTLWNKFMDIIKEETKQFFIFGSASKRKPSADDLRKRITWVLSSAGLGHKGLTSHSFRGGAATSALRNGVDQESIKRVGRWKTTSAMLHYIEPTPI